MRQTIRVLIGIVVPMVAIVVLYPVYNRTYPMIAGFPFVYFWIFIWFPLTTLCLYLSWRLGQDQYDSTEVDES